MTETERSTDELLEKYYLELALGAEDRGGSEEETPERRRLYEAADREVRELKNTASSLSRVRSLR